MKLPRRRVFAFAGMGLAGIGWLPIRRVLGGAETLRTTVAPGQTVSAGYWLASDSFADLEQMPREHGARDALQHTPSTIVPAERLPSGDSKFRVTGARITFGSAASSWTDRVHGGWASLHIDVLYPPVGGNLAEPIAFHAWSFSPHPVLNLSAASSFVVPVNRAWGLQLKVEAPEAGGLTRDIEATAAVASRFDLGRNLLAPKLRRGIYFLGGRSARTGALPDWGAFRVVDHEPGSAGRETSPFLAARRGRSQPADFPYVAFTVDYATIGPSDAHNETDLGNRDQGTS